jgi:hypothetical protein
MIMEDQTLHYEHFPEEGYIYHFLKITFLEIVRRLHIYPPAEILNFRMLHSA